MSEPVRIVVSKETPVNASWQRVPIGEVFITPDLARQIVALAAEDRKKLMDAKMNEHDLRPSAWASAAQSMGAQPVEWDKPQPVADDAAEYRRLCAACWRALGTSTYDGRSIPEHIESIRAELAAEKESHGHILDNLEANLLRRLDEAQQERDTARAELAAERADHGKDSSDLSVILERYRAERDTARAELAAERERREKAEAEIETTWQILTSGGTVVRCRELSAQAKAVISHLEHYMNGATRG